MARPSIAQKRAWWAFGTGLTSGSPTLGDASDLTITSGQALLVAVFSVLPGGPPTITGVTWNGTSLTQKTNGLPQSGRRAALFFLADPEAGTFNIVTTGAGDNSTHIVIAMAIADPNVADLFRGDAVVNGATSTTNISHSITSDAADLVLEFATASNAVSYTLTSGNSATSEINSEYSGARILASSAPGAAARSMGWTASEGGASSYAQIIVALKEAAAAGTKKIKVLLHPDATGDTGVAGVVFAAPPGSDITGAKIGEFSGQAFEATTESGQAVLKVPVSAFGGGALSVGASVRVYLRNSTDGSTMATGTVIEE